MSSWRDTCTSSRSRSNSRYFSRPSTSGSAIRSPQYSSASTISSRTSRSRRERWSISRKIASRDGRRRSACSTVNTFDGSSTIGTPPGSAGKEGAAIRDPPLILEYGPKEPSPTCGGSLPEAAFLLDRLRRGDHHPQLRLRLLDGPRLQAAVRVDQQLLRRERLEGPLDPVPDLALRLDDVAVDVDHSERDLLLQGLPPEPREEVEVRAGRVVLLEGPVHHRVRAREHPLQRALREALGPRPPVHRDRAGPLELPHDEGLLVVPVPVRPDEPAHLASAEVLREVRRHVPAVLLAVDEDVDPDLLLERDPLLRRPLLEGSQGLVRELALRVLGRGPREIRRLREAPDARREEAHSPASTSFAVSVTSPSFSRAFVRGRNSSPFDGETYDSSSGTFPFRARAAFARARGSSRRVFLAAMG